jgi:hypothetical protein
MNDGFDMKGLFERWPYDPERNVRVIQLADGRSVIQIRLPFGIEQYERDGRPDGKRPHGCESLLAYHLNRLAAARVQGAEETFRLDHKACTGLFEEGAIYYYRYLQLFELQDWERTVRDTARNIKLFDLTKRYAQREEDRTYLEQWRPYILRINAVAEAMIELKGGRHDEALAIVKKAMAAVEALPEIEASTFQYEHQRSLKALRELARRIRRSKPPGELDLLEKALRTAVEKEAFEHAAELRDRIQALCAGREPGGDAATPPSS